MSIENKYIKIPTNEAKNFKMIVDEMVVKMLPNLRLKIGDDIRKYLVWHQIDEFEYVKIGLYDLKNKNRIFKSSENELKLWLKMVNDNNWEIVDDIPTVGIL